MQRQSNEIQRANLRFVGLVVFQVFYQRIGDTCYCGGTQHRHQWSNGEMQLGQGERGSEQCSTNWTGKRSLFYRPLVERGSNKIRDGILDKVWNARLRSNFKQTFESLLSSITEIRQQRIASD